MSLIPSKTHQQGFSLIELMIALVTGLIVAGAVIVFIASIMRSNQATLAASRLNSELRSNAEIISREVRRARFVIDPITDIGSGCIATNTCQADAVSTLTVNGAGDCVQFAYDTPQGRRFQAIRVANGAVFVDWDTTQAGATCAGATTRISSPQVALDAPAVGTVFQLLTPNSLRVQIVGRLANSTQATAKTYTTVVSVRSGGV